MTDPFANSGGEIDLSGGAVSLVPNDPSGRCRVDGSAFYCAQLGRMRAMEAGVLAPVESFRTLRFKDQEGREAARSNPAEIDGGWNAAGDDASGWLYTRRTYDWKGQPRIITNTDGTQTIASYEGCGCAGGEVVTLTDEVGRQRKVYSDALGRQWKTETLDWDGNVYSTATNTFDALDRVMFARRYQGTDRSGVYQEAAMTYDGYGRFKTRKAPAESSASEYEYNADDTLYRVKDARGVYATYSYNDNRHLLTGVAYTVPSGVSPSIDPAPPVGFEYDAVGNRTLMTDGLGKVEYGYDALSRMMWEKRTFAPLNNAAYTINYDYNLTGELKSVTDPFGARVEYNYDQTGQVTGVTGQNFAGVQSYASAITYRAWGAVKGMAYGDTRLLSMAYDSRLRVKLNNAHSGALERAKLKPFRPYDCRHTFATRAAEAGVDLVTLAALLGHSRVQVVMRYAHPTGEHQFNAMKKMEAYRQRRANRK